MPEVKHSELPWTVRHLKNSGTQFFVQAPRNKPTEAYDIEVLGEDVGLEYPNDQRLADARLIVQAVNTYYTREDLMREAVSALKMADAHIGWGDTSLENVHHEVREVLAKLRAEVQGKTDALNEGICGAHSAETAQAYLFGIEDGQVERPTPSVGALEQPSGCSNPEHTKPCEQCGYGIYMHKCPTVAPSDGGGRG